MRVQLYTEAMHELAKHHLVGEFATAVLRLRNGCRLVFVTLGTFREKVVEGRIHGAELDAKLGSFDPAEVCDVELIVIDPRMLDPYFSSELGFAQAKSRVRLDAATTVRSGADRKVLEHVEGPRPAVPSRLNVGQRTELLCKRSGFWHFARRVPKFLSHLDSRGVVKHSTKIRVADDQKGVRAQRVADRMNKDLEVFWQSLSDGKTADAAELYRDARHEARAFGFDHKPPRGVPADRRAEALFSRLEALITGHPVHQPKATVSVPPSMPRLSALFTEYETLMQAANKDMSADQVRRWKHAKRRAITNLISVVRDKPLASISRNDALDFQDWWRNRVLKRKLDIGTANKDVGHISRMFKAVNERRRLGLQNVFSDLRIEGQKKRSRPPFPPEYVQNRLFAPGVLDSMNDDARRVIFLIAETGLRLSEAVNLNSETIVLKHKIPHVKVRPDGRRMKTDQSARDIPLVGAALAAMQASPNGFPRYRDKADHLSSMVNQFLTRHKLRPSDDHTLYSLRHTFEDRLTAVEAPEKLIANLMGHKYSRPKYGAGPSLEQKLKWLERIAFRFQRLA